MSGYKPGYSEAHSPMYQQGLADGEADSTREPEDKLGMDAQLAGSAMYRRGYQDGLSS
jgi:hypothetical protein